MNFNKLSKSKIKIPTILSLTLTILIFISTLGFWWPVSFPDSISQNEKVKFVEQSTLMAWQMDQWLQGQEQTIDLKNKESRSRVEWNSKKIFEPTDLSLVYIHGFSAGPNEIFPTVQKISENFKAHAYFQRLSGHGLNDGLNMGKATFSEWLSDALFAFKVGEKIGKKVVVIATSTGASLALTLAAQNKINPAALILISPNFRPKDWKSRMLAGPTGLLMGNYLLAPLENGKKATQK